MKISTLTTTLPNQPHSPLVVEVHTDAGLCGVGQTILPLEVVEAANQFIHQLFKPALIGHDARLNESALTLARQSVKGIGFSGWAARCYAAIDLALWDLKGKTASRPMWELLGGARTTVSAFRSLAVGDRVQSSASLRVRGSAKPMLGILVRAGGPDPEADVHFLQELHADHGESLWIAVSAGGQYNYDAAFGVGHFLEEDLGADWFEDPLPIHDRQGYARLADRLDVPLAIGSQLDHPTDFMEWISSGRVRVIRPDILRLGGLTATLPVIHAAQLHGLNVVPIGLPEVNLHLACGLASVTMAEAQSIHSSTGELRLIAPTTPGWGWHAEE